MKKLSKDDVQISKQAVLSIAKRYGGSTIHFPQDIVYTRKCGRNIGIKIEFTSFPHLALSGAIVDKEGKIIKGFITLPDDRVVDIEDEREWGAEIEGLRRACRRVAQKIYYRENNIAVSNRRAYEVRRNIAAAVLGVLALVMIILATQNWMLHGTPFLEAVMGTTMINGGTIGVIYVGIRSLLDHRYNVHSREEWKLELENYEEDME